ncbi:MAG TPA: glycosyltransferase family 39 protein, partial [Polyangia bacterium]|nr:glycosyltransferase family 39 protein [Polyangia bacterium]
MIAALVALATALRVAWVLAVPSRPVGDFALYLESAAHLLEHGAFDPAFIYMPGYVVVLAGVQALGGGVLAAKLLGAVVGGLGAWPIAGLGMRLFAWTERGPGPSAVRRGRDREPSSHESQLVDRRAGVIAGALYAVWPAGIAVASVTGTDMPAGVLLVTAVYQLVRWREERPWRAAILFGLVSGLAATVRAVAAPLAALSLVYWLASGTRPARAAALAAAGCAVAFLVLLPWGIRNQRRYGELFFTDSHGGHTALVGANPDTDGVYSRSLNLLFWKGTGFKLFDEPHRASDRAAYDLAAAWARFEPAYAAGLVVAKADRLLGSERPLLYWPVYRQGVLGGGRRAWFDAHRAPIEALVEAFWYALVALSVGGVVLAGARRRWPALALLLFPLALAALYATFFSEWRYHLAIVVFLFPFAGAALAEATEVRRPRALRPLVAAALAVALLFAGWPWLVAAGTRLRDRHRWAVTVCDVNQRSRLCAWKPAQPAPGRGLSPVHGVWDGLGLTLPAGESAVAAALD